VIPEHTDRAARIKQSRVKMMRLKAKIERGTGQGIPRKEPRKEQRRKGIREEKTKEKKIARDFQWRG